MKKLLLGGLILIAFGLAAYFFLFKEKKSIVEENIKIQVEQGDFEIYVIATGELQAKHSEKILGPEGMRAARIYQVSISQLVPEGTVVKTGDFVASLDRSELDGKIKDLSAEIEKAESKLTQTKIDTAIEMRSLRDQLVNLKFTMREKKLELEQSKYEPPAVLRRVELDMERVERDYKQQLTNYRLKEQQSVAKVQEVISSLEKTQAQFQQLIELSGKFTINAPSPGMVIYERSWNGKKGPGSRLSSWDPVVAQLPDMSSMISKTYVNEVDINKIKIDQSVDIQVDAFANKRFKGRVVEIANIGEQLQKFDAKVFEVIIELNETDTILRPAMTTSNQIITKTYSNVLHIPLEALHSTDSASYVFKELADGKVIKQEVISGAVNDNSIIIKYGIKKDDTLLLSIPENEKDIPITPIADEDKIAHEEELKEEKYKIQQQALKSKKQ